MVTEDVMSVYIRNNSNISQLASSVEVSTLVYLKNVFTKKLRFFETIDDNDWEALITLDSNELVGIELKYVHTVSKDILIQVIHKVQNQLSTSLHKVLICFACLTTANADQTRIILQEILFEGSYAGFSYLITIVEGETVTEHSWINKNILFNSNHL